MIVRVIIHTTAAMQTAGKCMKAWDLTEDDAIWYRLCKVNRCRKLDPTSRDHRGSLRQLYKHTGFSQGNKCLHRTVEINPSSYPFHAQGI